MNIVLLAATGRAGSTILNELVRRGHHVTAVARDTSKLPQPLPAGVTHLCRPASSGVQAGDRAVPTI